ncbi:MAG: Na+/H+ antiporter NhaC family protein [Elainellaceae cyanobacterium]
MNDLIAALLFSFTLLLLSAIQGYFILYPLLLTAVVLTGVFLRRGFALQSLLKMAIQGSHKAVSVLKILLLVGILTATWMASGTVPAIVYYGIQLISPHWFILAAFILTSFVSLLLGTSFGAASTVGIALMIMARGSDVNPDWIAGAVIAGAYFGDRCSPMSSSAHLVAAITQTDLYLNLRWMIVTGLIPLLVSSGLYGLLSFLHPVQTAETILPSELHRLFALNPVVLLPALVLMALALLRVDVKHSMLASIGAGAVIAVGVQHYSWLQVCRFALLGFELDEATPIQSILLGGGLLSMAKVCLVVVVSTAIAGLLAETQALRLIEDQLAQLRSRHQLFLGTTVVGIASAAFGCTQTIAILLTQQLMQQKYRQEGLSDELAIDLENTVVVLAPLIPWNIAGLVPATILMTDAGFIPYACYLYLLPLCSWLIFYRQKSDREYSKKTLFS